MPATVFGIGTRYLRRDSAYGEPAVCDHCGFDGDLTSYDASLWFTLFYLPLLPLGKKRVLRECPACGRHRAVALDEWQRSRDADLEPLMQRAKDNPGDESVLQDLFGMLVAYHDEARFGKAVPLVEREKITAARTALLVAVAHERLGSVEEARPWLERAVVLDETDGAQDQLDSFLARRSQATGNGVAALPPSYTPVNGVSAFGKVFLTVVLFLLLVAYGVGSWLASWRSVHVVNGLDVPYEVTISGQTFELPAHGRVVVKLEEGEWKVSARGEHFVLPPRTVEFATGFWLRLFDKRILVLNPDGCEVLLRSKVSLAPEEKGREVAEDQETVYAGSNFYALPAVDYLWQEFPDSLVERNGGAGVWKTSLRRLSKFDVGQLGQFLIGQKGEEVGLSFLRERAYLQPENLAPLNSLVDLDTQDKVEKLLERRLNDKPVLVDWHRLYQELPRDEAGKQALLVDYEKRLAAHPDDPELQYLLGRLLTVSDKALPLFRQAVSADPPSAYALNALAFHHARQAEFSEAIGYIERAHQMRPTSFVPLYMQILLALERYDELLQVVRELRASHPEDASLLTLEIKTLASKGELDAARELARDLRRRMIAASPNAESKALAELAEPFYFALIAYISGDYDTHVELLRNYPASLPKFQALITAGDLQAARRLLLEEGEKSDQSWRAWVELAGAAQSQGSDDLVRKGLERALGILSKLPLNEQRLLGKFVSGKEAPGLEQIKNLDLNPDSKRYAVAMVLLRWPELGESVRAFGRRFNYQRDYPYAVFEKLFASPSARTSESVPDAPAE